jgi:pimeloyl-ACP methyl ester carboxylesterase
MSYVRDEYYTILDPAQTRAEKEYLAEVQAIVSRRLEVDPRMLFMGGFSQGGYSTTVLGEQLLDRLAGLVILGAGRRNLDRKPPARSSLRAKPIFIGVGEDDQLHLQHARRAAQSYKGWGARVTFEEWPGRGHSPVEYSEQLHDWLLEHGPRKVFQQDLAAARKADKAGKLGTAYAIYRQLSQLGEFGDATDATEAAEAIEAKAQRQLAEVEKLLLEGDQPQAVRMLALIVKRYEGSELGELAQKRLEELKARQ